MELARYALRRSDDSIAKQTLQWKTQGETKDDQRTLEKEIWTAGGRWRRQHKTELDGDKTKIYKIYKTT